jgi:hypothetical protein
MSNASSFGEELIRQCRLFERIENARHVLGAHGVYVQVLFVGKGWLKVETLAEHLTVHVSVDVCSPDMTALQAMFERACVAAGVDITAAPVAKLGEVQP